MANSFQCGSRAWNDIQLFKYVLSRHVKFNKKEFRAIDSALGMVSVCACPS